MGCGQSRLDLDEAPASIRPSRRRMRGGRERKDSMMSTTDLLPSHADDVSEAASSVASPRRLPAEVEKRVVVEEKPRGEHKERDVGFEEGGGKGEKLVVVAEEEEGEDFPGSPSFRFYVDDVLDKLKAEEKSQQMDDSFVSVTSSEGSESKPTNKVKGKRMRSLKKGPNAVYNLFSARGCYNHNHHQHHHGNSAVARIAPHPTDDKEP
ncbi:uncharacterized protein M6B38_417045 [Iris pallida]|uniref:Uncharacterized protein n=1 Tax=Iris pallida TaxID=29817 RepID=A0AAX6FJ82_IRIPA|nr:uncharacterized protein M6B38_105255 [Iris pallida]KAJ6816323.1 uncharacterized protein M6B38_417045 [Iris pallida]